jgi:capsular exopolysaccharide synthesis family protein
MSEIFDFLRKTETENRKRAVVTSSMMSVDSIEADFPVQESEAAPLEFEHIPVIQEPLPIKSEPAASTKFDLENASYQLKNVLDSSTIIGEQFRSLRTRLNLMQKQNGIKTILVASTVPQEGKSFTSCGLAGIMAQESGKRIVVIDADMRKPGSGRDFGLIGESTEIGTAQVLQGNKDFRASLLTSMNPEFWFLPSGLLPSNPSELLSSPTLERVLKSAAESFDWVIVDSPPILALSDATMIAPLCDAVLLVVRVNSTPVKLVNETINRIGRDKICGVVLNRQKQIHSSRYYYQYYYSKSKAKNPEFPAQP